MVFKIIIVGIITGFNFYKLILLDNKIIKISYLFINLIYKIIYKKVITLHLRFDYSSSSIIIVILAVALKIIISIHLS